MKPIVCLLIAFALFACDTGGNESTISNTATPAPMVEWGNLVKVADTYEYSPPAATLEDFIALGQVAATPNAVCIVLWETATRVYAGCRNTSDEGQWPATCTEFNDGTVSCISTNTVLFYSIAAMGPARSLTIAEANLANEIRKLTYCNAPRLDGSGNPCVIL